MHTKGKSKDPSDSVLGQNRRPFSVDGVEASRNSHSATGNFYVDRSRIDTETKYDWSGGNYRETQEPKSIMDNARQMMGGMGANSSFKNRQCKQDQCNAPMSSVPSRGDD